MAPVHYGLIDSRWKLNLWILKQKANLLCATPSGQLIKRISPKPDMAPLQGPQAGKRQQQRGLSDSVTTQNRPDPSRLKGQIQITADDLPADARLDCLCA